MLGLRVLGVFGFWGFLARFSGFRVVMAHRRPDTPRPLRGSIHAPASQHAANTERVADHSQNSQDAPRTSVATCRATERVVDPSHNSEDAAQASVTTPLRTPGGLLIAPESQDAPNTPRQLRGQLIPAIVQVRSPLYA